MPPTFLQRCTPWLAAAAIVLSACPPPKEVPCQSTSDCTGDLRCVAGVCRDANPADAGADGATDAGGGTGGGTGGGGGVGGGDAGATTDGGSADDAGATTDGGSAVDAGATTDGGSAVDAGVARDGGVSLGDRCLTDGDCAAMETPSGATGWCKTTTSPGGETYVDGYCTTRCTQQTDCGLGNTCVYWMGPRGEADNLCAQGCPAGRGCRSGYACLDVSLVPGEYPSVCFPVLSDGGLPAHYDAGPGAASAAGTDCTLANQATSCGPSPYFRCLPAALPDGGPSSFPRGLCAGDCSLTLSDTWCGTTQSGRCLPYVTETDSHGEVIRWLCDRTCEGSRTCRTDYACADYGEERVCRPDCRRVSGICGPDLTCSVDLGVCE
jgi:hypothetical protein